MTLYRGSFRPVAGVRRQMYSICHLRSAYPASNLAKASGLAYLYLHYSA